jgi:hypothetical protein
MVKSDRNRESRPDRYPDKMSRAVNVLLKGVRDGVAG